MNKGAFGHERQMSILYVEICQVSQHVKTNFLDFYNYGRREERGMDMPPLEGRQTS